MSAGAAPESAIVHDQELASRVLAGDDAAFRQLYRRHTPKLFQLVLRLVGGREADAEDVVQEAWIKAVERLDTFRWEAAFGSWLIAIGINVARESARRHGRRREVEWVDEGDVPAAAPPARVEAVDLERAIAALPAGYRMVLVLHDVEGYTHEEIAERLGVAAGTTKSQLFWARRGVRAALAQAEGGNRDGSR
jgi:RNA polymerase sigma-70 factor (ECF subfamily)